MSERRKIVVENYPVERLPEDLRQRIGSGGPVRVTLEESPAVQRLPLSSYIGKGTGSYRSPEDAVAAINALRDEWD